MKRVAIVTGANRGIGYEIVRQLAKKGFTVILTARDQHKGEDAAKVLVDGGLDVQFHQLDVTDGDSIGNLAKYLESTFGKLDILINNAGIFIDRNMNTTNLDRDTLQRTMATNFFGPLYVTQALIPLLKKSDDGRIVNMSSGLGALNGMNGGYPSYGMSKTALNALTLKLAADLPELKVNCMCPGWVKTEMGGEGAERTVEEGADTAVWLATADVPSGKFFRDRTEIDW